MASFYFPCKSYKYRMIYLEIYYIPGIRHLYNLQAAPLQALKALFNMGLDEIPRCSTPIHLSDIDNEDEESIPDLVEFSEPVWDDDHELLPYNMELFSCLIDCLCSCCPLGECEVCINCSCRLDTSSDVSYGWCAGRQGSPLLFPDMSDMSEDVPDSLMALGGSPISSCNTSMSESLLRTPEMPQPYWRPLPPYILPDVPGVPLPDSPQSPDNSWHSWAPASSSPASPDASFSSFSSEEVGDEDADEEDEVQQPAPPA